MSAVLLLISLLLFVGMTALHPGGDANNHPVIFAVYAASHTWDGIHLGEFAGMAVLIAGLIVLVLAFNTPAANCPLAYPAKCCLCHS